MRKVTAIAATLFVAACSGAGPAAEPPAPAPLDPTGDYAITIDAMGQTIDGTLTISGTPGAYTGAVDTAMGGAPISSVTVEGDQMTFTVDEVGASFTVTMDGDSFSGEFSSSMGSGTIFGTKTSP